MKLLASVVLAATSVAACSCDESVPPWPDVEPLVCELPDAGPYDSGLPPVDAARTRGDGPVPAVTRFDPGPCDDWPRVRPMAPPDPDADWEVLWQWTVPAWGDPVWAERTDFERPLVDRTATVAVTADRVYVPIGDTGGVTALSRSGELLWGHNFPGGRGPDLDDDGYDDERLLSNPVATPEGGVLASSTHGTLYYWDRNGRERWRIDEGFPLVGPSGAGRSVALGPVGRIYFVTAEPPALWAIDRCGQRHWRADVSDAYGIGGLAVGTDGTLFANSNEAIYRFEPDGNVRRIYNNPGNFATQLLRPVMLYSDDTLHLQAGGPREAPGAGLFATRIETEGGSIVDEVQHASDTLGLNFFQGALDPFAFLTIRHDAESAQLIGTWFRPGDVREFVFPEDLSSFGTVSGGFLQLGCRSALLLPVLAGEIGGVVEVGYPGRVVRHLTEQSPSWENLSLLPSGLLVVSGPNEVTAIQTNAVPGPGWSHPFANSWNTSSHAVQP